jgi:hypothetical protein
MKNVKMYVFGLIMGVELVIMGTIAMLAVFWLDMMDNLVFLFSIPIIGFLLVTMAAELLFRIYMNSQILRIKNQKELKDQNLSPEEMISLEMAFNRNEGFWVAMSQYFWITCLNLYAVFSMDRYDFFVGGILVQIVMTLFLGIYGSVHNKKCYRDGMLTQAIYYAAAYQTLCKELIDYSNEIDRRAREDVVNIIQRQKKTNQEKVKELQDDFQ